MRLYHDIYQINLYFCSKELWLLMDAYFRVCTIFATCSRKLLRDITYWFWGRKSWLLAYVQSHSHGTDTVVRKHRTQCNLRHDVPVSYNGQWQACLQTCPKRDICLPYLSLSVVGRAGNGHNTGRLPPYSCRQAHRWTNSLFLLYSTANLPIYTSFLSRTRVYFMQLTVLFVFFRGTSCSLLEESKKMLWILKAQHIGNLFDIQARI